MDFTRRVAPYGESERSSPGETIKMVYPLAAIPSWVAGRYFYDLAGKIVAYLLLPLLGFYALYRAAAYVLALSRGTGFFGSSGELPRIHELFLDVGIFGLIVVTLFAAFFVVIRHLIRRTLNAMAPNTGGSRRSPAEASVEKVEVILRGEAPPPMSPALDPSTVDVFVSGHTHLPSLTELSDGNGRRRVAVNSGCYLRQLQPVRPRLKGPPIFVSRFVLTHVRVHVRDGALCVELWEQPKPARQSLSRLELLLSHGRRPPQPEDSGPRVTKSSLL